MVGERVLLWVSPMKGVIRFGKKDKLSPRYIGPFEILKRVVEMADILALPPSLSAVHPIFHVSMLRKYYGDLSHVLDFSSIQLDKDLTYKKELVAILAWQVRKLRPKSYPSMCMQCREVLLTGAAASNGEWKDDLPIFELGWREEYWELV
ncbi:uncharacterized protein [Nicotiana sylvestris]|uniref:uncharacterized protein n=1 Tax=Nicotiana sylvestris TaxID=4096 RepID=UPI00388C9400